ncbi:MAG: type II toxin-antitoxin system PemK/MazF family toxin [Candidatus Taylorbacteria bacterium]|nr:type II toxin-antitoxin system PemK/MazF family toxin [Candidatus Taylorbacteria bacterium]
MQEEYIKDFDSWNEYAKKLDKTEPDGFFRAREIWWCALGVNIGSEQDGKNDNFVRPVLVLYKIRYNLALIVPLTSKIADHEDRITFEISSGKYQILLSQLRTVSAKRLLRNIGYIRKETYKESLIKLAITLLKASTENETPPISGESRSPKAS